MLEKQKIFYEIAFLSLVGFLALSPNADAGTKVLDYDFEDWTGSADTTPGYIFSATDDSYWCAHTKSTEVLSASTCPGSTAHSGSYFFRTGFVHDPVGPCLTAEDAGCILYDAPTDTPYGDAHSNVGLGSATYPSGSGDKMKFNTSVTSGTILARFWFRSVGDVKHDPGLTTGHLKFFRMYGTQNNQSQVIYVYANPELYADSEGHFTVGIHQTGAVAWDNQFDSGVDFWDGDWHSFCYKSVRLNGTTNPAEHQVSVWMDDWDMTGSPVGTVTVTNDTWGTFNYFVPFNNWSADYPSTSIALDIDDVEVWDGLPAETLDITPPASPTGLSVI